MGVPEQEPVESLDDLVTKAMELRPDVAQARLQITNSEISLEGSKSALRPELDLVASAQDNGLADRLDPGAVVPSSWEAGRR
jgi:outer membrane protein TolC